MKSLFTLFFVAVGIILARIARHIVNSSRCGQDSGKGAVVRNRNRKEPEYVYKADFVDTL